jgi:hypothetical protein
LSFAACYQVQLGPYAVDARCSDRVIPVKDHGLGRQSNQMRLLPVSPFAP